MQVAKYRRIIVDLDETLEVSHTFVMYEQHVSLELVEVQSLISLKSTT